MKLKNKYILALTIALGVLVFNQVYIQYQLSKSEKDAHIINMAGKQRMYSQKILHEYESWFINEDFDGSIFEAYNQWKISNEQLLTKAYKDDDLYAVKVLKSLDSIISKQKEIINITPTKSSITMLNSNMEHFLFKMDNFVKYYELKAGLKLDRIKGIELGLFLSSIIIILFEVVLIFYPLIKKLRNQNQMLSINNKKLENKKKELEQLAYVISHDIQEPLSLVEGIINRFKKKE